MQLIIANVTLGHNEWRSERELRGSIFDNELESQDAVPDRQPGPARHQINKTNKVQGNQRIHGWQASRALGAGGNLECPAPGLSEGNESMRVTARCGLKCLSIRLNGGGQMANLVGFCVQ